MQTPIGQAELDARVHPHLDELLALWWAEQGVAKPKDLELMALTLQVPREQAIRVLDLCCGPGDVGRAIRKVYPHPQVDGIDRDPFLTSLCAATNQRDGIPGMIVTRDLTEAGWTDLLPGAYDVVATVNALHWFTAEGAADVVERVHRLLRPGGTFVLAEPAGAERRFAAGRAEWKEAQPPRYSREHWERFWSRANQVLGYDHTALLGARDAVRIGDTMTVAGWVRVLEQAGFRGVDVLLRDADQVILGASVGGHGGGPGQ